MSKATKPIKEFKKSDAKSIPKFPVTTDHIAGAISALENSRSEIKTMTGTTLGPVNTELLTTMKAVFAGNTKYRCRLAGTFIPTSSGVGVMSITMTTNLNNTNGGTTFALLFDEVRLVRSRLKWKAFSSNPAVSAGLVICFVPSDDGTAVPTTTLVSRIPGVKLTSTADINGVKVISHGLVGRHYASTAGVGHSSLPVIDGCLGSYWLANMSTVGNNATYGVVLVESIYEFRNQA